MTPRISAIICTHDRPTSLQRALQSLTSQTLPQEAYEIIVVDNTKDGSARQIVETCSNPQIRYIHEPILGLSRARNTGYTHAKSAYIAYIDDDAIADPDWLKQILIAFALPQRPACVGGEVTLSFETERPLWLEDQLLFCLGRISHPNIFVTSETPTYVHGCNIAFEKQVIKACGGFDTRLGRVGKNLISYEETTMQGNIEKQERVCIYDPRIKVTHVIPKERLTKRWFMRRMYSEGISSARMHIYRGDLPFTKRVRALIRELQNIIYEYSFKDVVFKKDGGHSFTKTCMRRKNIGYLVGLCGF